MIAAVNTVQLPNSGPNESMRINISVKPNANKSMISFKGDQLSVSVTEVPEKGKATIAVLKLIKKELGIEARLVKGATSKNKIIELYGNEAEIAKAIDSWKQKNEVD